MKAGLHRLLTEVFKWLQAQDLLLAVELVCLQWRQISLSDEIWTSYLPPSLHTSPYNARNTFQFDLYRPNFLPFIHENHLFSLQTFNFTLKSILIDDKIEWKEGTILLILQNNDILVSGGWKCTRNCRVSNRNQAICEENEFESEKSHHGLVEIEGVVYCFGGYSEGVVQNRVQSLQSGTWTEKARMNRGIHSFNPAKVGGLVCIPSGNGSDFEVYDVRKDEFAVVSVVLPMSSAGTVVWVGEVVTVLGPHTKALVASTTWETVVSSSLEVWWRGWSDLMPVLHKGKSYLLVSHNNTASVYIYDHYVGSFSRRNVSLLDTDIVD